MKALCSASGFGSPVAARKPTDAQHVAEPAEAVAEETEARLQRLSAENDAQHAAERAAAETAYTATENANVQAYREAVAQADWRHADRKKQLAAEAEASGKAA